jgi:hypothetical protein
MGKMKKPMLVILLVIIAVSMNAQPERSLIFGNAVAKYKKMETAGIVLTVIGGAALFTGNILYWKTFNDYRNNEPPKDKVNTYSSIMLGGIGLMAVGIPLWAIGKTKERHITIEARLVKFKDLASANGIGIKIRF